MKKHPACQTLTVFLFMITLLFGFSVKTQAASYAPSAPKNFKVTAGEYRVRCTWTKVSGAAGYVIYYKDTVTGVTSHTEMIANPSLESYTVKRLNINHKYILTVHAYRYIGGKLYYSPASAKLSATPTIYEPKKPFIQIGDVKSKKCKLTWKEVFGATGYQVFIKDSNGRYRFLKETKKPYVTIKELVNDQRYTFAVRSVRRIFDQVKVSKIDTIKVWVRTLNDQIADINDQSLYTAVMNRTVTAKRTNGPGYVTVSAGTQVGVVGWTTTIQLRSGVKCKVKESDITRMHDMFDEPRAAFGKSLAEYYVNHWKYKGQYSNKPVKSDTNYLIWANPYTEHTYVFQRKVNQTWELIYSWNCITGKYETQSIYGVWKILKKVPVMYFPGCHANYGCLFTSDGNAFHSLRYSENRLIDTPGFVGYAASAGCIRLDNDNIKFLYDHVPVGTKVIIH